MIFRSKETSLNYWVIMTRLIFIFLAGSMAPRICQSIPWLSCVARAGSGETHFQTVQGKELFITIDAAAKRIEILTAGAKDNIHVHLNCKYHPWGLINEDMQITIYDIERFHSRGQRLCKFIGTKESVYIRKEFNSHRTGLVHQHGRRFIVLEHQYGRRDVL